MPYACNYGRAKHSDSTDVPAITTGHCATVATIALTIDQCCESTGLDFHKSTIAVFGAGGMLGRLAVEYLLNTVPPRKLILIELPGLVNALRKRYPAGLHSTSCEIEVAQFDRDSTLPSFDGAVLATNQTAPYLTEEHLRRAKFWIDDTHPRAVSCEVEEKIQGETLYVECYLRGPAGLDVLSLIHI